MNAVSDSGTPVLCLAARHGRCDVLNVLLSYGAQGDISAKYVRTYLRMFHMECVCVVQLCKCYGVCVCVCVCVLCTYICDDVHVLCVYIQTNVMCYYCLHLGMVILLSTKLC